MAPNPPQTLSVKRKRTHAPVDALVYEQTGKRQKSTSITTNSNPNLSAPERIKKDIFYRYVRVQQDHAQMPPPLPSPASQGGRFFHIDRSGGSAVFVEKESGKDIGANGAGRMQAVQAVQAVESDLPVPNLVPQKTPPRKRPGAGTALNPKRLPPAPKKPANDGPSEDTIRQFEAFSEAVENEDVARTKTVTSPSKYKPKPVPRFRDRHPELPAAPAVADADAMDIDDYVYDTYVREEVLPDASGKIPEPQGTVGFIMISEEDEDWWLEGDDSDIEFDTDEEDENAENYYANDYPEDEMSSDDEFDRELYKKKYRHGSDDEEYDVDDYNDEDGYNVDGDFDDDGKPLRKAVPKAPGYWGRLGE